MTMEYEMIRSRRKTISAQVKQGRIIVRAPLRTPDRRGPPEKAGFF